MMRQASSGRTASARRRSSAGSTSAPRASTSSIDSVPSTRPSIVTTCSRSGSASRTNSIFATWVSSSQTMSRPPELPTTHWHSSGELDG